MPLPPWLKRVLTNMFMPEEAAFCYTFCEKCRLTGISVLASQAGQDTPYGLVWNHNFAVQTSGNPPAARRSTFRLRPVAPVTYSMRVSWIPLTPGPSPPKGPKGRGESHIHGSTALAPLGERCGPSGPGEGTRSVPTVKRNCMSRGGISVEPSFESSAQAPQAITLSIEYQNHSLSRSRRWASGIPNAVKLLPFQPARPLAIRRLHSGSLTFILPCRLVARNRPRADLISRSKKSCSEGRSLHRILLKRPVQAVSEIVCKATCCL
jgi:hypothetical protein